MSYKAPTTKDRVALGDDKYTITDLPDGRKLLTPSPDSVTEPGTEINKDFLDPLCKAVERIDESVIPYALYWWRRRATSASYTENRVKARSQGGCISHQNSLDGSTSYYVYFYSTDNSASRTIQVSSAITINQSSGAITLKNPTSYSYTESSFNRDTFQSTCAGKYVKGLSPKVNNIYFIPSNASIGSYRWNVNGEEIAYIGYEVKIKEDGYISGIDILMPLAKKNTTIGGWESVSSPDPDAYPHSGTSGGYDWIYLGTVSDAAISPPESEHTGVKIINLTSSDFVGGKASVRIPYKRYWLWIGKNGASIYAQGVVSDGAFTGRYMYEGQYGDYEVFAAGSNKLSGCTLGDIAVTSAGIEISGDIAAVAYMPI